jgi:magnesium transporter
MIMLPSSASSASSSSSANLKWIRSQSGERLAVNKPVVRHIGQLIKAGEREQVRAILKRWHPRDVIELMVQLPLKRARKLFFYLPTAPAAKLIAALNDDFRTILLEDATIERLVEIVDSLGPEEAVDALDELPDEVRQRVVSQLRHSATVQELLTYQDDSAGSMMTRKCVAVPPDWTLSQVISEVRRHASVIKKLSAVYVVDRERHLLGYLKLRDLLLRPKESLAGDNMRVDFVAVRSDMDQEQVVQITRNNNLISVPVIDANGCLLGRITADELQRVIQDEAEEDARLMTGMSADARPDAPVLEIVKTRLPWLLAGLVGAILSGSIIGRFEHAIASAAILASFIPIVMSMAGNAGIQAATVAIQGLATETLWIGDLPWRLGRELLGALCNGLIAALLLAGIIVVLAQFVVIPNPLRLAFTAASALTAVTLVAVTLGAAVPLVLNYFRIDPAMATGIFITTGNDILAVLLFFVFAAQFYL